MRSSLRISVLILPLLSVTGLLHAQEPPPMRLPLAVSPQAQFNTSPPGARALGAGGSFLGLSDDATAAETNPAGLTILSKPEVSAHFRYAGSDIEIGNPVSGGSAAFSDSVASPSFFSFVYPKGSVALAAYYHEPARIKGHSLFIGAGKEFNNEIVVNQSATNIRLSNLGFAAGYSLNKLISIGWSIRLTTASRDSTESLDMINLGEVIVTRIDGTERDITFSAGLLLNPTRRVSAGFVFKQGANFEFDVLGTVKKNGIDITEPRRVRVLRHLPDFYGGGITYRASDRLTVLSDILRIKYGNLNEGVNLPVSTVVRIEPLRDATEIHLGVEYSLFAGQIPVFIRGGLFTDPDHDLFAEIDSSQTHFTFGAGIVMQEKLQLDLAANISDSIKEFVISSVYRF